MKIKKCPVKYRGKWDNDCVKDYVYEDTEWKGDRVMGGVGGSLALLPLLKHTLSFYFSLSLSLSLSLTLTITRISIKSRDSLIVVAAAAAAIVVVVVVVVVVIAAVVVIV